MVLRNSTLNKILQFSLTLFILIVLVLKFGNLRQLEVTTKYKLDKSKYLLEETSFALTFEILFLNRCTCIYLNVPRQTVTNKRQTSRLLKYWQFYLS